MVEFARRRWWVVPPLAFGVCASASILLWRDHGGNGRLALELLLSACLGLVLSLYLRTTEQLRGVRDGSAGTPSDGERAREYHRILGLVNEGMLVVRPDGRILTANDSACAMHGYPEDSIEVASIGDLFVGEQEDLLGVIGKQIGQSGQSQVECVGVRRDRSRFEAVLRAVPTTRDGKPALLISVEDMTEKRQAADDRTALSRKVLVAQEEERTRISRDLHDSLGQIIAALHFEVDWMHKRLAEGRGSSDEPSDEATRLIDEAGNELRRICRGLRPPLLDDLGLMPSIRQLVEEFEAHRPIKIDLEIRLDEDRFPVPPDVALSAFRVLQETLTNVARHADASKVNVTLVREYQWLVLSVYDNGRGFRVKGLADAPGFGIEGMRERARLVNGTIEIRSVLGQGTRVVLRVPVPRMSEEDAP